VLIDLAFRFVLNFPTFSGVIWCILSEDWDFFWNRAKFRFLDGHL